LVGAGLVSGCGGDDLECGDGTAEVDGTCVAGGDDTTPPTTAISPDPGTYRTVGTVTLTADEPAIIFFTTDGTEPGMAALGGFSPVTLPALEEGTEIRFFAIDDAGNREATQTAVYTIDRVAPAPACGFTASATDLDATVSWTNPSDDDFGGSIVVRYDAVAAAGRPVGGDFYSVGDNLPGGGEVIFAGTDSSLTDTLPAATGAYTYAVWTHDALGNYSIASSPLPLGTDLGSQTATVTVDLATNAVTIDQQPAGLALQVTANYNAGTQALGLEINARNNTRRHLFNLRVESTNVTTQGGGVFGGVPPASATFGNPLATDGSGTANLGLTGVPNSAATATVELELESAPYILSGGNAVDSSGGSSSFGLDINFGRSPRDVLVNPQGTQALFTQKKGAAKIFDLVGFEQVGDMELEDGWMMAGAYSNAGVPFVITHGFAHWQGPIGDGNAGLAENPLVLHELNPITMEAVRSFEFLREEGATPRSLLFLPDCRTAAVLVGSSNINIGNKLVLIDLNAMEVTSVIDLPQPTAGPALAERAAASADGSTIYVGLNSNARALQDPTATDEDEDERDLLGGGGGNERSRIRVPLLIVDVASEDVTEVDMPEGGLVATGILPVGDIVYYASRSTRSGGTTAPVVAVDTANSNALSTVVSSDDLNTGGAGNIVLAPEGDVFAVWPAGRTSTSALVVDLATGTLVDGAQVPSLDVTPHGVSATPF